MEIDVKIHAPSASKVNQSKRTASLTVKPDPLQFPFPLLPYPKIPVILSVCAANVDVTLKAHPQKLGFIRFGLGQRAVHFEHILDLLRSILCETLDSS